jgi:hypothetical protein
MAMVRRVRGNGVSLGLTGAELLRGQSVGEG